MVGGNSPALNESPDKDQNKIEAITILNSFEK